MLIQTSSIHEGPKPQAKVEYDHHNSSKEAPVYLSMLARLSVRLPCCSAPAQAQPGLLDLKAGTGPLERPLMRGNVGQATEVECLWGLWRLRYVAHHPRSAAHVAWLRIVYGLVVVLRRGRVSGLGVATGRNGWWGIQLGPVEVGHTLRGRRVLQGTTTRHGRAHTSCTRTDMRTN